MADLTLVGKVPVERPLPHARSASDLVHAGGIDPLRGEELLRDRKQSLAIDALVNRFPPATQRGVAFAVDLALLVALAYFCKLTFDFIAIQRGMGHKLGGATGLPSYVMTLSVLVGFASMTVSTIASLLKPGGKGRNEAAFT